MASRNRERLSNQGSDAYIFVQGAKQCQNV
jgi:hypothetical protein